MASTALTVVSQVIGWLYFLAWSVSFYPQLHVNYKLKQTNGYSMNFIFLNWSGFLAYSIYSITGIVDPSSLPGVVDPSDVAFAVHAWILVTITIIQCAYYEASVGVAWARVGLKFKVLALVLWLSELLIIILQVSGAFKPNDYLSWVQWLGYMKITITLVKYIPQAYLNYVRKSTVGWSIINVLLDFTGGLLSILQIFIDGANTGQWNVFEGGFNLAKFCLGLTSIVFDIVFMLQHYLWYPEKPTKDSLLKVEQLQPTT
jgi:cystinosin